METGELLVVGTIFFWVILIVIAWISYVKQKRKFEKELECYQNSFLNHINKEKLWTAKNQKK